MNLSENDLQGFKEQLIELQKQLQKASETGEQAEEVGAI